VVVDLRRGDLADDPTVQLLLDEVGESAALLYFSRLPQVVEERKFMERVRMLMEKCHY
jgi:hypothetical protein